MPIDKRKDIDKRIAATVERVNKAATEKGQTALALRLASEFDMTTEALLECIERCDEKGIRMYGGGQFELGAGRRQIQKLASVFYPDGPNDVAPSEYNDGPPRPGLPTSPLPAFEGPGF